MSKEILFLGRCFGYLFGGMALFLLMRGDISAAVLFLSLAILCALLYQEEK